MNTIEAAIHDRQKTLRSISQLMALPDSEIREAMNRRRDLCSFAGRSKTSRGDLTLAMNFVLDEINRFKSYADAPFICSADPEFPPGYVLTDEI